MNSLEAHCIDFLFILHESPALGTPGVLSNSLFNPLQVPVDILQSCYGLPGVMFIQKTLKRSLRVRLKYFTRIHT